MAERPTRSNGAHSGLKPDEWPLVGREPELARVGEALARPERAGVVFAGPPGVGKTRLATECIRLGEKAGFATARAMASRSATGIPFGALAPLLPPGRLAVDRGVAMLQQAREALAEIAGGAPLLLLVDDAHALDDASALLLHQLATTSAAFIVVTLRTGEPVPAPVLELWKDQVTERIDVEPLGKDATVRLAAVALGGQLEGRAAEALWNRSHGNALFLRELVLGAVASGALVERSGRWRLAGELVTSPRLAELVESRLSGLDTDEINVLELVALGEPVGVDLFQRPGSEHLMDALEGLERKALIVVETDRRRASVRLSHPLHGEVVRARMPVLRGRSARRILAEWIEGHGIRRREDPLRVALWRLDGGGVCDPSLLFGAALQARFANDMAVAERLARAAHDARPSLETGNLLQDILYKEGRGAEQLALLATLEPFVETEVERAGWAAARATSLFWLQRRADEADDILAKAIGELNESQTRDEMVSLRASLLGQAGRAADALCVVEEMLDLPDGRAFVQAALTASMALPGVGRPAEALAITDRAFNAHLAMGNQLNLFQAGLLLVGRIVALTELGRLAEAEELGRMGHDRAVAAADKAAQAFFALVLARTELVRGRVQSAANWAREAVVRFSEIGHGGPLRWSLGNLILATSLARDVAGAREAAGELEALGLHPARMLEAEVQRGLAWLAVAEGDPARGRAILEDAVDEAMSGGNVALALHALYDLARLGDPSNVAAMMEEIIPTGQSPLHQAMIEHAAALVADDPKRLGAVADQLAEMGAGLVAAEAATSASEACARDGDQRASAAWARRAGELSAGCEGARTPGLAAADTPVPLTRREREIALLAAEGLASKVIAERLFLSVRTVDNHLARVYEKLGVTSRAGLASAIDVGS